MYITKEYKAEYNSYNNMKQRCLNKNNPAYKYYGSRGIKICDRWLKSFENFLEDMGPRPSKSHSIDRINNNGNYTPENCRWATQDLQVNNRRDLSTCVYITYKGKTRTLTEWAKYLNINADTLWRRLNIYNHSLGKALKSKKHITKSREVLNLDTGEIFTSLKEAAVAYKGDNSSISKACKGKLKTSCGQRWTYLPSLETLIAFSKDLPPT